MIYLLNYYCYCLPLSYANPTLTKVKIRKSSILDGCLENIHTKTINALIKDHGSHIAVFIYVVKCSVLSTTVQAWRPHEIK